MPRCADHSSDSGCRFSFSFFCIKPKKIAAGNLTGYAEARRAPERIHDELERISPSAARSLGEGLEETLTIHRLDVPAKLRLMLFSTDPIASTLSVVEEKCGPVKRWQGGEPRWVASGLLFVAAEFRRVKRYREIPHLMAAIQAAAPPGQARPVAVAKKLG